ncbi:MAG: iron-only hydrogenase system regulator [Clostridia bacterium]|nr:iron-only hydrogenase system regulator [Clostridia bacterium]
MEKKLAVLAIIVNDFESVNNVNALLHEYGEFVRGRLGLPCKERGVSVISVVLDADMQTLNSLSGKLGMIKGVSSKLLTTK